MVFDKGELIHDWKRDYIFNNKPINGESRSKSIVGVAALGVGQGGGVPSGHLIPPSPPVFVGVVLP